MLNVFKEKYFFPSYLYWSDQIDFIESTLYEYPGKTDQIRIIIGIVVASR
jgi:hypothetical protein